MAIKRVWLLGKARLTSDLWSNHEAHTSLKTLQDRSRFAFTLLQRWKYHCHSQDSIRRLAFTRSYTQHLVWLYYLESSCCSEERSKAALKRHSLFGMSTQLEAMTARLHQNSSPTLRKEAPWPGPQQETQYYRLIFDFSQDREVYFQLLSNKRANQLSAC